MAKDKCITANKLAILKANSIKVNNELHLKEGIGFDDKKVTNEKLTVLCSQLNDRRPRVLSYVPVTEEIKDYNIL